MVVYSFKETFVDGPYGTLHTFVAPTGPDTDDFKLAELGTDPDTGLKYIAISTSGDIPEQDEIIDFKKAELPPFLLANFKDARLQELNDAASKYDAWKCDSLYVISSLGSKYLADHRAQSNIADYIAQLSDDNITVPYKDYDDIVHQLNKTQLTTLYTECKLNGENLYKLKWGYMTAISETEFYPALMELEFDFPMMDFSKAE